MGTGVTPPVKPPEIFINQIKMITLSKNKMQQGNKKMVEVNGIEPMTSWLQTRRSPS
jgi:hypothetical protein